MEEQDLKLIRELADREAIRDLMYRYGRGVDSVNLEAVLATFDDPSNLVVQSGSGPLDRHDGRKAVEAFYQGRAVYNKTNRLIRHRYKNPLIELNGDTATASVYWDEIREENNTLIQAGGTYFDKLRRTNSGWKFAERRIRLAYRFKIARNTDEAIKAGDVVLAPL
jgi:3-phenylpropionate/cinnamic acid dioxygenase small subunit